MTNKKASFKFRVLIPITMVFVVLALVISIINYRLLQTTVITKTNDELDIFTDNILTQIDHLTIILDTTKQMLNEKHITIAKSIAYILDNTLVEMTPEALQRLVEPFDILEINIADANGIVVCSNCPEYIGFDYKSTDVTKAYMALTDGTLGEMAEEPRYSIVGGEIRGDINHYSGVARAIGNGFIQLGFDASVIEKLQDEINIEMTIKSTKLGENGFGMVISNGLVSAHPDTALLNRDVSGENWYKSIKTGSGFTWIEINGDKYYAGYKNANGYTVVGLVPEKDFYRELNQILIETVASLFLAILVMVVVVYFILGRLLTPVRTLSTKLGEIAKGDLDVRITDRYNDEFDEIKNAVNAMAEGIKTFMNGKLDAERAAHESELAKSRAEAAREAVISSIEYASKIQRNLLPPDHLFKQAFSDYCNIWMPRDIVGGDIYWIKNYNEGTVLCVCDCTGHGTPGALLTMLVVSTFEATVNDTNYKDPAAIIWELEKKLVSVLNVETPNVGERGLTIHDGCDLAVLYIANDGSVALSAGNMPVFVCDGERVKRFKGQRLRIGDGTIKNKDVIQVVNIPANRNNKFYIASDGLYEQVGGEDNVPFGYSHFADIILVCHGERQSVVAEIVWQAFEDYRGDNVRRDDFELITFKPYIQ